MFVVGNIPGAAGSLVSIPTNNQTGTSYTPVLGDGQFTGSTGSLMALNSTTAQSVIIPPNSSVAYPVNTVLSAVQLGTGKVTFVAGNGVTIYSAGNFLSIGSQYVAVTLMQLSANVWLLIGSLSA